MKYTVFLFMVLLFFCSCEDFLTEEPETEVTNNNFWKTEKDLEVGVNGMYKIFRFNHGNNVSVHLRDRGLVFDGLGTWAKPSNNDLSGAWGQSSCTHWEMDYQVIMNANLVLDNISRAEGVDPVRYRFYEGQALALRAYMYFYILRHWGDVPLILHVEDVGEKARTPWQEVAEFCISDLKQAASMLPVATEMKDSDGNPITSKLFISRGTCHAILAHLYAWKAALNKEPGLNKTAILYCDSVISDHSYALAGNVKEVCEVVIKGNSPEGIFEADYEDTEYDLKSWGSYVAGYCQFWPIVPGTTPASARRGLTITNKTVYALYPDEKDQRREEYFYKLDSMAKVATSITKGNAYPRKYRHTLLYTSGSSVGKMRAYEDNEIIIRLADIILLRAELKNKTGDTRGAIADLNLIRERAGCSPYSGEVDGDLANAIQDERDREFFCEGVSIRYFDIVRNGMFRERLRGNFKTLTDQDVADGALFVPVGELAFSDNTLMRQTPYWKRNGFDN